MGPTKVYAQEPDRERKHKDLERLSLPYRTDWKYPTMLLVIGGLLLQPILGLSSPWRRALSELLPERDLSLNSPERTHRPLVVSLLSGSAILAGDTVGKDLG